MIEIKWLAPILDASGYAAAARGYLNACLAAGIKIKACDRSRSQSLFNKGMSKEIIDLYRKLSDISVSKDCLTVQHTIPEAFVNISESKKQIGYTIFEMRNIPNVWVTKCNQMDELWTGSEYSKQSFLNSNVTVPIHVLPHAIDAKKFKNAEPWKIENKRSFAFLSVFDFTPRKAWKELLRAYWSQFTSKDDVCLILKVFFGDFSDEARKQIITKIMKYKTELQMSNTAPILLYGHDIPDNQLPGLYKSANAYVSLGREGFGLGFAEAMASGLLTIGPEIGGNRQFMNEQNSILVKHTGKELIAQEMLLIHPQFKGIEWETHSWEDLAIKMRKVVEDTQLVKTVSLLGQKYIEDNLSFSSIGNQIKTLIGS